MFHNATANSYQYYINTITSNKTTFETMPSSEETYTGTDKIIWDLLKEAMPDDIYNNEFREGEVGGD
ncbi:hypothetical protein JXL19_06565 [bacterium]|nr:hypothetical protein [bacterium]